MHVKDDEIKLLLAEAKKAMTHAYAPYSKFTVGCALLMEDGKIFHGVNVENASYGVTICAERSAIASAVSQGYRRLRAVCVTNATETLITPCGICRQVILEFTKDAQIICSNKSGAYKIMSASDLMSDAFHLDQFER